ncbi:MAG: hypothetical protein KF893_13485 [Caldilineaceae bacterium]|nr:hypothetical protein [Caldilineaceae bacterium]
MTRQSHLPQPVAEIPTLEDKPKAGWRGVMRPATQQKAWAATSSAVLDARIWLERSPWRVAGGWSMLAGLLSAGIVSQIQGIDMTRLLLLFLLVDLLWGSIWGAMTLPNSLPNLEQARPQTRVWLPYLRANSPASHLFGYDRPGILPLLVRVALPGIALALLVAAAIDPMLLWLTLAVVILSVSGWLHRQVELVPLGLLHTLVSVSLPWWAALQFVSESVVDWRFPIANAALWTIHMWGANRSVEQPGDRLGLTAVGLAQIGVSLLVILAEAPFWLALLTVLWLPTWLSVYRRQSLRRVEWWWLLAMLISSLAMGQRIIQ